MPIDEETEVTVATIISKENHALLKRAARGNKRSVSAQIAFLVEKYLRDTDFIEDGASLVESRNYSVSIRDKVKELPFSKFADAKEILKTMEDAGFELEDFPEYRDGDPIDLEPHVKVVPVYDKRGQHPIRKFVPITSHENASINPKDEYEKFKNKDDKLEVYFD